jgi:tRNA (guanine-N7-)-methyltransferase
MLPEGDALDPASLLDEKGGRLEIEIGPGRGGFVFERLAADETVRMIGLEIRRKWATIVDGRIKARGLGGRGRVFAEDARFALPRFRGGTVSAVFIHFPDPWWKKRHQKRMVASTELLRQIARLLVPGGELFFQTDVSERAEQFEALVEQVPEFRPWGDTPRIDENPYQAMSPRERRAVADGLPVVRLRYRHGS